MPTAEHEILDELDEDALALRLAALTSTADEADARQGGGFEDKVIEERYGVNMRAVRAPEPEPTQRGYRYFEPLPNAADEYIAFARTPYDRTYTGIEEFDQVMRGIAPSELLLVVGFAHSGKTVFTTEMLLHNKNRRVAFFTPDETRVLVLIKLVSIVHGISAEDLEYRIYEEDDEAIELVRSTARDHFPNLAVFDKGMDIDQMHVALDEAEDAWGAKAQCIIFDYADLLVGVDDSRLAISALKSFGKRRCAPMVVLHQSSRSAGADGRQVTISSGGYGGEQQATFLVGVRRKKSELMAALMECKEKMRAASDGNKIESLRERIIELEYELTQHENTVTFNLLKNKRPPSRLVDEIDFRLDPSTGRVQQLGKHELPQNRAVTWEQEQAF